MRPASISICRIVIRDDALSGIGVVHTNGELSVFGGNAISARVGAEVGVEGAILLHDDDDMFDFGLGGGEINRTAGIGCGRWFRRRELGGWRDCILCNRRIVN